MQMQNLAFQTDKTKSLRDTIWSCMSVMHEPRDHGILAKYNESDLWLLVVVMVISCCYEWYNVRGETREQTDKRERGR